MGDAAPATDPGPSWEQQNETDSEVAQDGPTIWERIRRRLDVWLGDVELHAHRLLDRDLTLDEAEAASSAADALAVALGGLEQHAAARLARHLVSEFEGLELDSARGVHLAATCEDIRTLMAGAIAQLEATPGLRGVVAVVGEPSAWLDTLCWVLAGRGFTIDAGDAVAQAAGEVVGALVDATDPDGALAALRAVDETWSVPVIAFTHTTEPGELRDIAAHAAVVLGEEAAPSTVVDELVRLLAADAIRPSAVLCGVDDGAAACLSAHGFELAPVAHPDRLIGHPIPPDAVVVFGADVIGPVCVEAARLIRATPATRRVPIVWHQADASDAHRLRAAQEGVVVVDEVDDVVVAGLSARLRAASFDAAEEELDGTTLLHWAAAQVLVDRSFVAAHRSGRSVAFVSIDIGPEVATEALPALNESFAREFRRGDVVCQRSERNLVVALQGVSRRIATNRMTELFDRLPLGDGSAAGVAVFPNDGRTASELAVAADAAKWLARTNSGPPVVSTTWRPEGTRGVDVLIVDQDESLTHVIARALSDRGVQAEECHDGRAALERLVGDDEHQRLPSVVLLDMDTPGLDGLALVRRLGRAGVLNQLSVLLMTARSSEPDLRLAIELGVTDAIRKPFSTTLLVHRVGRLLQDA